MRRLAVLGVLIVAGLAFAGNDAWKTKPYQQWDANDVKEVLWNSPWVKDVSVPASWPPAKPSLGAGQLQGAGQGAGPQGYGAASNPGAGSMGNSQAVPQVDAGAADGTLQRGDAAFYVRWNSAMTVREAMARQAVLQGQLSEDKAQQFLTQAQNAYQVQVSGSDMAPFMSETEDSLKSKTYIEIKPSKKRINPSDVQISKAPNGLVQMVLFSFPKQDASGEPVFGSADKQLQLNCKLKDMHLDATFDLHKMTGQNGPDL
jgi:hypothetical protein